MTIAERVLRSFDFIRTRKRNYQLAFRTPAGNEVLIDLARYCRASETCVVKDSDRLTWVAEGRREVWLRIQQHLHLTSEQLMALYSGQNILLKGDTNG